MLYRMYVGLVEPIQVQKSYQSTYHSGLLTFRPSLILNSQSEASQIPMEHDLQPIFRGPDAKILIP